jgi:hypothetical protein
VLASRDLLEPLNPSPTPPDFVVKPFSKTGFLLVAHTARAKAILWNHFDTEGQLHVAHRDILPVIEQLWCTGARIEYERRGVRH